MNDRQRRQIARHESAHATMAFLLGEPMASARIASSWLLPGQGDTVGQVKLTNPKPGPMVLIALAGSAADRSDLRGWDLATAEGFAEEIFGVDAQFALSRVRQLVKAVVATPGFLALMRALAAALMVRGKLSGIEVNSLLAKAWEKWREGQRDAACTHVGRGGVGRAQAGTRKVALSAAGSREAWRL